MRVRVLHVVDNVGIYDELLVGLCRNPRSGDLLEHGRFSSSFSDTSLVKRGSSNKGVRSAWRQSDAGSVLTEWN
jgi:hypothetical protein